jgi:hypothetical protein
MSEWSGPKIKTLNKETVTFVLMENLNLPVGVIGEIVELVWLSNELLESCQISYAARVDQKG